ncbi:MAG: sugar ABC transporter permease [Oscillospiraceae bacterium]|jgi:lactose/L-arabinose transport system permease protein|nr:sugar ABC transporter permease [Oscillospiraceae bacterium]
MTDKAPAKAHLTPRRRTITQKRSLVGWAFLLPAALLILWMNFYPMFQALWMSLHKGIGAGMTWAGLYNYERMFKDTVFQQTLVTTFTYLIVQVPVMLVFAIILASLLNDKKLKCKGFFRTAVFLPCTTSLVSYSIIFRSLFAADGYINHILVGLGILETGYNFLGTPWSARMVIIIALLWRWTGYNMIFFLAALQNIDSSIYEAARIDGASPFQQLRRITMPLLKPMILLTAIMSTNGTLQLFDESFNLTRGGPGRASLTMSHYLYQLAFEKAPNFGYATAVSYVILALVAVLALIQMRVGDKR